MNKVQWKESEKTESMFLGLVELQVKHWKGEWVARIFTEVEEEGNLMHFSNHPTREEAKNHAIQKARELLLADLKQLET